MRCHWCDRRAIYAPESDGIRVGLCRRHLQARLAEFGDAEQLAELGEKLES